MSRAELAQRVIVRVLAVLGAVALLHVFVWRPWKAQRDLSSIDRGTTQAENAPGDLGTMLARRNVEELQRLADPLRTEPDYYLLLGWNARLGRQPHIAVAAYTAGMGIDRRPELYIERGATFLDMGREDDTVRDWTEAVRFNPALLSDMDIRIKPRVVAALHR